MNHETLIIGGGPAGAAAAILLARAGRPARLLERQQGAHDKVCGEFISWEATQILQDLGLDLPAMGAQPVEQVRLFNGDDVITAPLPFTGWSLSRCRLDKALLEKAELAGVAVQLGVAARDLSLTDTGWTVSVGGKKSHRTQTLGAKTLFLATGKHDLRNWRRTRLSNEMHKLLGLKMHLHLDAAQQTLLRETVEIHLFDGGYAGLELVEQNKANLCLLINKDIYRACGKRWSALLQWLGRASPCLQTRLAGAQSLWPQPLAVYGVPYGHLPSATADVPGLFRLGDQTAVIPSLAGDGIAIALQSAQLAANIHAQGGPSSLYQQQAQRTFRSPVYSAQFISRLFSHALGRKAAFSLSRRWPSLITEAIVRTRMDCS